MKNLVFFLIGFLLFTACNKVYTPKPRGYFRISFPEKSFSLMQEKKLPFTFEIANYSQIEYANNSKTGDEWVNVVTPSNNADLHLTYLPINQNLSDHIEESRKLAYEHTIKADAIDEQLFLNPKDKVYGTIYYIKGNAASPLQFYLTDSTRNFLRAAFYIREIPNIDSIQPVIDFLEPDIIHLIETFRWE